MKKLKLINIKQVQAFNPCGNRLANAAKYYSKKSYTYAQMLGLKNITHKDKVWLSFHLMPKTSVALAAADMAELVLPLYEYKYPQDKRSRLAIKAARSRKTAIAYDAYIASADAASAAYTAGIGAGVGGCDAAYAYAAYACSASAGSAAVAYYSKRYAVSIGKEAAYAAAKAAEADGGHAAKAKIEKKIRTILLKYLEDKL